MRTVASLTFLACLLLSPVTGDARGYGRGPGHGTSPGNGTGLSTIIATLPYQELSPEEETGLEKMREEEKLARDVYQTLFTKWGMTVFSRIASSEQRHMDAVKALLDKYSRPDPVTDPTPGVFTDPELQQLYNDLVAQGQTSMVDALQVGATIEDLDIKDLYDLLAQTDNTDIQVAYQNLVKGSRNHLRAFVSLIFANDAAYGAQFLTQEQIDAIVASPRERGMVNENGEQISANCRGKGKQRRRASVNSSRLLLVQ